MCRSSKSDFETVRGHSRPSNAGAENSSSHVSAHEHTRSRRAHSQCGAPTCNSFPASLLNPEQPLGSPLTPAPPSISGLSSLIQSYYYYLTFLLHRRPSPLPPQSPGIHSSGSPTNHPEWCIRFIRGSAERMEARGVKRKRSFLVGLATFHEGVPGTSPPRFSRTVTTGWTFNRNLDRLTNQRPQFRKKKSQHCLKKRKKMYAVTASCLSVAVFR